MKFQIWHGLVLSLFVFGSRAQALAAPEALLTSLEGSALVLTAAAEKTPAEALMTYEGRRFAFATARIGAKLTAGQILMTNSGSKGKVIFQSGDVVIVGPSSAFAIPVPKAANGQGPQAELLYGKVRAVINPKGPLSGLQIKTATAVTGIRGTDLFIGYNPAEVKTQVVVMRGEVNVTATPSPEAQIVTPEVREPIVVHAGQMAQVASEPPAVAEAEKTTPSLVQLLVVGKQDLETIQKASTVATSDSRSSEVTPNQKAEIKAAEQSAQVAVLQDVRRYESQTASDKSDVSKMSVEELNKRSIETLQIQKTEVVQEPEVLYLPEKKWSYQLAILNTDFSGNGNCYNCSRGYGNQTSWKLGGTRNWTWNDRWQLQAGLMAVQYNMSVGYNSQGSGANFYYDSLLVNVYGLEVPLAASVRLFHGLAFLLQASPFVGVAAFDWSQNQSATQPIQVQSLAYSILVGFRYTWSRTFSVGFGLETANSPVAILPSGSQVAPFSTLIRMEYAAF